MDAPSRRSVGILAFDAMEVLDYAGPYEVFSVAAELSDGGFTVVPDVYDRLPVPDVVIVPGGSGTSDLLDDTGLLQWGWYS